ncbi:DUF1853 family protein [Neolewinella aurantiaca]|uniref:DUF1853 family protein n=1 Tax=Neolewinella aurantiaca TaxID=2602767 RepID=A0A5C7FHR4_9BACT|nr:DUF1853 family protein [Neolewinella aurantiaca]TXF85679.1 DUF1853 family protein [Neolewinella aurantiaca]
MDLRTQLRYQACISTPPLWEDSGVSPFDQINLSRFPSPVDDAVVFKNHRLGKVVEEFIFHQLKSQAGIGWIEDNLQIQKEKRTIGEIDALYRDGQIPVHLEVAYKFYLLDSVEDHAEPLARWIGPNRKDNLFYKLRKLHDRQFPLLHNPLTRPYLDGLDLEPASIVQRHCFKGQLFLPYHQQDVDVGPLNRDCVAGYYFPYREMSFFREFEFHLPDKLDWLVTPHDDVAWITHATALKTIGELIQNERSPMAWMKANDGTLSKCFIVFW